MSDLHHTLFVVSCLAALGLGLSGGLVYLYYGHWRPTIRAYQAALRDIHRLTRHEVQPEDKPMELDDEILHEWEETIQGWQERAVERLRMIARRTV